MKLAILIAVCALAFMIFIGYISTSSREIGLRNQTLAQQDVCKAYFDTMWKTISQKAGVSKEYRSSFKEIYSTIMEGRYGNARGGALMSWVHEANPNFDASIYKELSVSIEALRTSFFQEQKKLIDFRREHKDTITRPPSSWFVGGRPLIDITIITSAQTEEVYKKGQENKIELFDKK